MMCYTLGAFDIYDGIYDIKTVRMTIFQPRRDNISTFEMGKENLLNWADTVLAPTRKMDYLGMGAFKAGASEAMKSMVLLSYAGRRAAGDVQAVARTVFRMSVSIPIPQRKWGKDMKTVNTSSGGFMLSLSIYNLYKPEAF